LATDFTVIMRVRHQFGDTDRDRSERLVDHEAPFVGRVGTFPFSCPDVDPSEDAILEFQYRGSAQYLTFPDPTGDELVGITAEHPVSINGNELAGGVPRSPNYGEMPLWSTRLLLIGPGVLKEENELRIESAYVAYGNRDNFTVDNAVVFFKTRAPGISPTRPEVKD
jgi:hypothetical protein